MNKALSVAVLTAAAAVSVPGAQAATCSTAWGSGAKAVANQVHATVNAVRAGHHACFDRVVLDDSRASGYRVRYVTAVRDQGRGAVVPLAGGAFLQVDVQDAATRRLPMPDVRGYPTVKQVAWGGSFEGYTTVGIGARARLPFRVFRTTGHLVIDVAHHWVITPV